MTEETNGRRTAPQMPAKLAAAICKVMGAIEKLAKDEKNPHANYRYAGIESFLEMVRPLCAEHGLIIVQDEEGYEFVTTQGKSGPRTWLVVDFSFTLAHSSGETWGQQPRRSGMADASMGSQAFGAAQSFALKALMRSLLQIATGDTEDSDKSEQDRLPDHSKPSDKQAKKAPIKYSEEESKVYCEAMVGQIGELTAVDAVADYAKQNAGMYGRLTAEHQGEISKTLSRRKADLQPKSEAA
ncbi:MAG: ERF family protein [Terriglobales bacterium]